MYAKCSDWNGFKLMITADRTKRIDLKYRHSDIEIWTRNRNLRKRKTTLWWRHEQNHLWALQTAAMTCSRKCERRHCKRDDHCSQLDLGFRSANETVAPTPVWTHLQLTTTWSPVTSHNIIRPLPQTTSLAEDPQVSRKRWKNTWLECRRHSKGGSTCSR